MIEFDEWMPPKKVVRTMEVVEMQNAISEYAKWLHDNRKHILKEAAKQGQRKYAKTAYKIDHEHRYTIPIANLRIKKLIYEPSSKRDEFGDGC